MNTLPRTGLPTAPRLSFVGRRRWVPSLQPVVAVVSPVTELLAPFLELILALLLALLLELLVEPPVAQPREHTLVAIEPSLFVRTANSPSLGNTA